MKKKLSFQEHSKYIDKTNTKNLHKKPMIKKIKKKLQQKCLYTLQQTTTTNKQQKKTQ